MVVCVGNCTATQKEVFQPEVALIWTEIFNSKRKEVQHHQIKLPQEIDLMDEYFHELTRMVKDPIDYFCFRLPYCYGNEFRKKFVATAKQFNIKNVCIIGEIKALLMDSLALSTHSCQDNDVFWIIEYCLEKINCYVWKYKERFGWMFHVMCVEDKHNTFKFRRDKSGNSFVLTQDLENLKEQIKKTEIGTLTPCKVFVFTLHGIGESGEENIQKVFPDSILYQYKPDRPVPSSCLEYSRYLSGENEYAKYRIERISERLIIVKVNDEMEIKAGQFHLLPLTERQTVDFSDGIEDLKIYENDIHTSSIKSECKGQAQITLQVDINDIYDISVNTLSIPVNSPIAVTEPFTKPLKNSLFTFQDDGVPETAGLLNIDVDTTDNATFSSLFHENEVYRNFTSPKGLALIINNKKFVKYEDERHGTEIDEKNIRQLLTKLGYKVNETQHNLSGKDMLKAAQNFANDIAHRDYDSCIVVVLTHGAYDVLLGSDGERVILHDFVGCFNSKNAPLLKAKPKLFFLQACRGEKYDEGTDKPDCLFPCLQSTSSRQEPYLASTTSTAIQNVTIPSIIPVNFKQPIESDMLIAYATPPNYVSWRNMKNGSWFIQSICEVFSEHSKNEDICSLLTKVNNRVSEVYEKSITGQKQIPDYSSRLRKKFYFFPGIYRP